MGLKIGKVTVLMIVSQQWFEDRENIKPIDFSLAQLKTHDES